MDAPVITNPLDALVGYRLRRASARLMTELATNLDALNLSPTEASVLLLIAANPGVTQSVLGRTLGIKRANMTPLTAGLERRGLLARERVDGRSHGLVVTADGSIVSRQAVQVMEEHDARLLARLVKGSRESLASALTMLIDDAYGR